MADAKPTSAPSAWSPLAVPAFRTVWTATLVANVGEARLCDRATAASQVYLEANGYRVSRDCNNDVLLNINGVFEEHAQHNNCYPHPQPLPTRGRGADRVRGDRRGANGQTLIFSSAMTRSTAGRLTMRSLNAV